MKLEEDETPRDALILLYDEGRIHISGTHFGDKKV